MIPCRVPHFGMAFKSLGFRPRLVELISSFHANMFARVRVGSSHTDRIEVRNGLRQGCSMAPMLFNLFFSLVLETWRSKMEELCPGHSVSFRFNINGNLFNRSRTSCKTSSAPDLELADDAVLITPSREAAQIALSTFADVAASFGLSVNFPRRKSWPVALMLILLPTISYGLSSMIR